MDSTSWGFPCASLGKESTLVQETLVQSLGREVFLEKGNGNPLQYSRLGNPMDRGAWWTTVCEVAESDTTEQLDTHTHTHTHI